MILSRVDTWILIAHDEGIKLPDWRFWYSTVGRSLHQSNRGPTFYRRTLTAIPR